MDSPLPPDPYTALGISNKADAEAIKKAYRKLALKLHPDKCQDESQKASRTDEFTKIQQAYDLIGDEDKRGKYDAMVRLAELRRQNMEMRGSSGARPEFGRAATYDVRTAAPREASYSARGPPRPAAYEERRPKFYDEYEATRGSTRKASEKDEYVYVKRPATREKEKVRVTVDPREEDHRRETRRREAERTTKYARDEYEEERRRKDREYEELKRKTEAAYEDYGNSVMEDRLRDAQRHMQSRKPSTYRTSGSREVPVPEVRRSAAPPKEKERARETRRASPNKDERRRMAENIDSYPDRRVPTFATHVSSPPVMENMPPPPHPQRSYTTQTDVDPKKKKAAKDASPPPPILGRATTQPIETIAAGSSKRKESSKIRLGEDSGHAPTASTPVYSSKYMSEPAAPPRIDPNYRTILREPPSTTRRQSTSPTREDPRPTSKTAAKMVGLDPRPVKKTQYVYPTGDRPGPTILVEPARASRRERVSERDRDYKYTEKVRSPEFFGENGAGTIDPRYNQPKSFRNEEINFAPRISPEDVRYSSSRRDRAPKDNFPKPGLNRASTTVY